MTQIDLQSAPALDAWLKQATRHLSRASAAQVRAEIQEHYESARESALSGRASEIEADRQAMAALGNAKSANRQYRKVLLTASEARLVGSARWESRVVCSRPLLKWLLRAMPIAALCAAAAVFAAGESELARVLLAGGIATGLLGALPTLRISARYRRILLYAKWAGLMAAVGLAFWPYLLQSSWLMLACMWQLAWTEWMKVSVRRKLALGELPRQLHL